MAHGDDEEARWLLPPRGEPPPRGDGQPWKLLLLFSFLVGLGLVAFDVTKYASNALSPPGEKLVLAESTVLHVGPLPCSWSERTFFKGPIYLPRLRLPMNMRP